MPSILLVYIPPDWLKLSWQPLGLRIDIVYTFIVLFCAFQGCCILLVIAFMEEASTISCARPQVIKVLLIFTPCFRQSVSH